MFSFKVTIALEQYKTLSPVKFLK